MLNLPITEGELTFLAKFVNCAPILLCGRIAHTAWLCMKRFSKYMSFKIEILLIPLLQAISHIFEISEDDHPLKIEVRWSRPRYLMNFRLR